ncbi:Hypothetical protein KQS_00865 [Flavobacterium indicum GPTSA100-9 = DSM 17447]|uniref:Uncharacterized protein n=2 Tax=Flavobacterium TaxID=237 RepID=H8XNQ5_FLAIG|nr:Hypothetical protein KQS_00865 [Flavobacterium indicum GPTSA100-9 = DSM 17447]
MTKKEIILKIDEALLNVDMPPETRELLIELRSEIPRIRTKEEIISLGTKWAEIITKIFIFTSTSQ